MNIDRLLKLSGMSHHGGKTADHWEKLVGVSPKEFQGYIQIKPSGCWWLPSAEKICRSIWNQRNRDTAMLTSRSFEPR